MSRRYWESEEDEASYASFGAQYETNDDNRANQLNPNHPSYWKSRGFYERPDNWRDLIDSKGELNKKGRDNRANQKNPNHMSFWKSRGFRYRPSNWEDLLDGNKKLNDLGRKVRDEQNTASHIQFRKLAGCIDEVANWKDFSDDDDSDSENENEEWYSGHTRTLSSYQVTDSTNTSLSTGEQVAIGVVAVGAGLLALGGIVNAFRQANRD